MRCSVALAHDVKNVTQQMYRQVNFGNFITPAQFSPSICIILSRFLSSVHSNSEHLCVCVCVCIGQWTSAEHSCWTQVLVPVNYVKRMFKKKGIKSSKAGHSTLQQPSPVTQACSHHWRLSTGRTLARAWLGLSCFINNNTLHLYTTVE